MKALILLLAGGVALAPLAYANDAYQRDDAWEYFNLAALRVSSTWVSETTSFDPYNLFGAANSTQEGPNGHYAFTDSDYPSFDWVEWDTLQASRVTGYSVYLLEDVGRVAAKVRFLVDTNGSGNYVLKDEFVPSYTTPHLLQARVGLAAETTRPLEVPVVAKRFRMEFERESVRFMNGIRVIEIDAITTPNPEAPHVQIVNPAPGQVFVEGDSIQVEIEASDPQLIARVELYANEQLIAQSATERQFTVSSVDVGFLHLKARAVDQWGAESEHTVILTVEEKLPQIRLGSARSGGGYFYFDVDGGRPGSSQVISWSLDFLEWTPIRTNAYPAEPWTFSVPIEMSTGFFRVEHISAQ